MLSSLLLLTLYKNALGDEFRINDVNEFVEFSDKVNHGMNYSGTTVFLDADIEFTKELASKFNLIGNVDHCFIGTFNGQGHTISNLAINSPSYSSYSSSSTSYLYVGLFGYSKGAIIKNIILDSSCSIKVSGHSDYAYVGSVIGRCSAVVNSCSLENNVNMASITFTENIKHTNLYAGGIVGYQHSPSNLKGTLKNCANYGGITHPGTDFYTWIGGVVGYLHGYSTLVYNCLNYGSIVFTGEGRDLYAGGIIGKDKQGDVDNCVSVGAIASPETNFTIHIGGIIGEMEFLTITNCYWNETISYSICGLNLTSFQAEVSSCTRFNNAFELSEAITVGDYVGTSLVEALNAATDYYTLREYSHWILNKNHNNASFAINGRNNLVLNSEIILLPDLANEGYTWFDGWYTDSACTTKFTAHEIDSNTEFYGKFTNASKSYTIFFETRSVVHIAIEPITAQFGSVVILPDGPTRSDCNIKYWKTIYGEKVEKNLTMPAHNVTLYAVLECTHITSIEEFFEFSNNVNSEEFIYRGSTIYLDIDIDLSGKMFEPIGSTYTYYFVGSFDGQGHTISNLVINSTLKNIGLFGYSGGANIKNIILDSSCSISNFYSGTRFERMAGGIIGECNSLFAPCIIENSVNMGKITFIGNNNDTLIYGGIVGALHSTALHVGYLKNCANYGTIEQARLNERTSYIGGIAGYIHSDSSVKTYSRNCLNYGNIHITGAADVLYIGAIVGYGIYSYNENCVNYGTITHSGIAQEREIGNVIGHGYYSSISHCYWNGINNYSAYGYSVGLAITQTARFNSKFELNETVTVGYYDGASLIEALNAFADYYTLQEYSNWVLNRNRNYIKFVINNRNGFILNSGIVLLPSIANELSIWFDGWYINKKCTVKFTVHEINDSTELYGKFETNNNSYTITFDTKGGDPIDPITAHFASTVALPENATKPDCEFLFWETNYGERVKNTFVMPAYNITLHAMWLCIRLKTADDLLDLSKIVNSGIYSYKETTIFLDADIDLSGKVFEPIGSDDTILKFNGVFDGQGHTINNLVINSTKTYVGLFGDLRGATIKNVVLGSSCSITNLHRSFFAYVGSIAGYCGSYSSPCTIENCINKADVSFYGNEAHNLKIGGIIGFLSSVSSYTSSVKNCINYGAVTHYGKCSGSYIGGIVGYSSGYSSGYSYNIFIQKCENYGEISLKGESMPHTLFIDGIVGEKSGTAVTDCVNHGKVSAASSIYALGVIWMLFIMFFLMY